jgi:hypothetical protein
MILKWHLAVPLIILAMAVATAASAHALRTAAVDDQIGSLVTGLTKVDAGPLGSCGDGAPTIGYVDYVVPSRPTTIMPPSLALPKETAWLCWSFMTKRIS